MLPAPRAPQDERYFEIWVGTAPCAYWKSRRTSLRLGTQLDPAVLFRQYIRFQRKVTDVTEFFPSLLVSSFSVKLEMAWEEKFKFTPRLIGTTRPTISNHFSPGSSFRTLFSYQIPLAGVSLTHPSCLPTAPPLASLWLPGVLVLPWQLKDTIYPSSTGSKYTPPGPTLGTRIASG
jgi:hypothetical protein